MCPTKSSFLHSLFLHVAESNALNVICAEKRPPKSVDKTTSRQTASKSGKCGFCKDEIALPARHYLTPSLFRSTVRHQRHTVTATSIGTPLCCSHFSDHENCLDRPYEEFDAEKALGEKGKTKLDDWAWFETPNEEDPRLDLFDTLFPDIEDWALEDEWEPQTVADFTDSERWKVSKARRTIFIQPLAFATTGASPHRPSLQELADFTEAYFGLPVKILDPLEVAFKGKNAAYIGDFKFALSTNEYGDQRLSVLSAMDYLFENTPTSAYCVLAVTDMDIYENAKDPNAIMGRGSGDRVGILSLYRFNPQLGDNTLKAKKRSQPAKKVLNLTPKEIAKNWILAACKTLAHESMHMFGLDHCTHYMCVMNANLSPLDDGKDPIHLCPICLRKLFISCKFDLKTRFEGLLSYYQAHGWSEEAEFVKQRILLATHGLG